MWATVLQWVSVVSSVLAALSWFLAAAVKIPGFRVPSAKRHADGTWERFANPQEGAFKRQSTYTAIAGAFAIIAAVSTAALMIK